MCIEAISQFTITFLTRRMYVHAVARIRFNNNENSVLKTSFLKKLANLRFVP